MKRSRSVRDVQFTLLLTIALVVLVMFLFAKLRPPSSPALRYHSVIGTFGIMYLAGSASTISLMALTISTGFVVDDAIVIKERSLRPSKRATDR
jgi:multidrug efflux pump